MYNIDQLLNQSVPFVSFLLRYPGNHPWYYDVMFIDSCHILKLRLHVELFSCACNAICLIAAPEKISSCSHENILFYATKISKKSLHATCNKIDPDLLHAIFSLLTMTPSLSRQMLQHFYRYVSVKPIKIVYLLFSK